MSTSVHLHVDVVNVCHSKLVAEVKVLEPSHPIHNTADSEAIENLKNTVFFLFYDTYTALF